MKLNLPRRREFKGSAQIWKRILAFLIDLLIIDFFIFGPFKKIIKSLVPAEAGLSAYSYLASNPEISNILVAVSISSGILAMLYFAVLEWKLNQTVGKILLKLYVESDFKKLKFWQCLVRSMFVIPVFPFILLWIVDPIYLFWKNIRFSEAISKTKTIQVYLMR